MNLPGIILDEYARAMIGQLNCILPFIPFARCQLEALGLQQGTAFACLFDFLYRPTKPVVRAMAPLLPPLLDPENIKVGGTLLLGTLGNS